jgi:membrane protein DedA with SNARE-associated domain
MGHAIFETLRGFIVDYGYWAVALALLCENAGLPIPGETTLLLASFLAQSEQKLHLGWIIVVGTCAATMGDNLGYAIGRRGGRPLFERYQKALRIPTQSLERGEKLFARYGAATIFFARFIFGMRVFAGPLAGVLRMPWKAFALFNLLGAMVWVTVIASAGYLFGEHWSQLEHAIKRFDVAIVVVAAVVGLVFWWKRRRERRQSTSKETSET